LLADEVFHTALKIPLVYTGCSLFLQLQLQLPLALGLALLLDRGKSERERRLEGFFRLMLFSPNLVGSISSA
jgi:ABC-type sugar transport system permease subunit